jgi:4-hydroxy-2-oxoheptanedioate aldolase
VTRNLAARIRDTDTLYGLVVKMPAPAIVEAAGYGGFDLTVIDTEHGIADGRELEHHLRAADAAGIDCLVRVGGHDPTEALRALDAGATGIVVPHVTSAIEARAAVSSAHYPPLGRRGLAVSTRAGRQGTTPLTKHIEDALERTVVIAQIEDGEALHHIDDIASTPRLDALFVGPNDLSISLGHPGEFSHPHVVSAIDECVERVHAAGNASICVLVSSVDEAHEWQRRGARIVLFTASALLAGCIDDLLGRLHASTARETVA